jgi:hypothetical protein
MIVLAAIDGTGPSDDFDYRREFDGFPGVFAGRPPPASTVLTGSAKADYSRLVSRSNVKRIVVGWEQKGPALYQRGPGPLGLETKRLADTAAAFVEGHRFHSTALNKRIGIFLVGYSRGGAAAIDACCTLASKNIKIDCLLLFDAVDRTFGNGAVRADRIPPNVRCCYHAIRDPHTFSRAWFENCGRRASRETAYKEKSFFCSHGAVGGLPWTRGSATNAIEETDGWVDVLQQNQGVRGQSGKLSITPEVDMFGAYQVQSWSNEILEREIALCESWVIDGVERQGMPVSTFAVFPKHD